MRRSEVTQQQLHFPFSINLRCASALQHLQSNSGKWKVKPAL
jgi:hypothetical protein